MISKIIRQTLLALTHKVELYLENSPTVNIKLNDIKKIIKLWINFDDLDELKLQLEEFDA